MSAKGGEPPSETWADRLATAAGSACLAAVTLFAAFVITRYPLRWYPFRYSEFEAFYSQRGLVCAMGGAALLGFLIGPRRMAEVWGAIWRVFESGPKNPW